MKIGLIVASVAATVSLVACTSDDNTGTTAESSASTPPDTKDQQPSASGNDGPTIPDGSYRHVLTSADRKRYGLPRLDEWAPNDTLVVVHRFEGDEWAQSSNFYGDALAVGSSGSVSYDEGRLILNEACCGTSGYEWSIKGDQLIITPDVEWSAANSTEVDPGSRETKIWMLMTAGTYTKIG